MSHGDQVASCAIIMPHKTQRPVQFEIAQVTRDALQAWIKRAGVKHEDCPSPADFTVHLIWALASTQYARILGHWVDELGLERGRLQYALDA